jgi:hypothetical protein
MSSCLFELTTINFMAIAAAGKHANKIEACYQFFLANKNISNETV